MTVFCNNVSLMTEVSKFLKLVMLTVIRPFVVDPKITAGRDIYFILGDKPPEVGSY